MIGRAVEFVNRRQCDFLESLEIRSSLRLGRLQSLPLYILLV